MTETRLEYILACLEKNGRVKGTDLSRELNCSEVTIRSDIQKLEERGLVRRIRGGAVKKEEQLLIPFTSGNIEKKKDEKIRIAARAYQYIDDQDTIILDDASVNYYLAQKIKEDSSKYLIVITNSLICAGILASAEHVELFVVGGQIGGRLAAAMGDVAVNTLANFRASKAFISAHGINFSAGVTSIGSPQMQVKKAVLESADKVFLLVDSSKFGGGYILVVCPLDRIDRIITDDGIRAEDFEEAKAQSVNIDIV
ncbi:MAG: DeoR/GlpR family DNA-binding transcription regulator [Lachnospiraceae bacterium]